MSFVPDEGDSPESGVFKSPAPTALNNSRQFGHQWDEPHGSAYGTQHPIDRQLGRVRRLQSYAASAKGGHSTSDSLHEASAIMSMASMGASPQ